jgi:hypothetical protein
MEQINHTLTRKTNLSTYRKIVEKYLPAVIIKCSKFTNSKHSAEIITIYTFLCVYRLTELLDDYRIPVLINAMFNIVGEDFADGSGKTVGDKLFEQEETLSAAKFLSELDTDECISRADWVGDIVGQSELGRITKSIMRYLIKQY